MNKEQLLGAVNVLIHSDNAAPLYEDMIALMPAAKTLGARFSDYRAVLNPLLELALPDRESFNRVVNLIERKRAEAALPPMHPSDEEGFNKTEYMRDFMAQKRERERRAVSVENLMRSKRDQLRGRARLDFMQAQSARWKMARDHALQTAREAEGKRLSRQQVRAVLDAFWATVDQELDRREHLAREEHSKPVSMRKKARQ